MAQAQESMGTDVNIQETILLLQQGEAISPLQKNMLSMRLRALYTNWEYEFIEYQLGNITLAQFSASGKRGLFLTVEEVGREVWESTKNSVPAEFVEFMDKNVFY